MNGENAVCAAHSLLVDNVRYIRKKQDETSVKVQDIAEEQLKTNAALITVQTTQAEILKLLKRKQWTPARKIALVASLFGSGSVFPAALKVLITAFGLGK